MIRRIVLFISITYILSEKYLIETADKEGRDDGGEEMGEEGGSDYSFLQNLKMEQSGQFDLQAFPVKTINLFNSIPIEDVDVAKFRGGRRGRGNIKKYIGESMRLSCKVRSFLSLNQLFFWR